MTFEELDQRFPNGFVDAEIRNLSVDYRNRTVVLEMNLRGNPPDSAKRDEYRRATLTARGFYYFSMEPPDPEHLHIQRPKITVDGFSEDSANFHLIQHLKTDLHVDTFICRFFVHDWNSFIHIAAKDAEFLWTEHGASGDN
ncbi:MAG TPA: hypothetical protein VK709_16500 [Candidatus Saccharimonadales bacterium]|jgi:hypothetical protein|nr:hypothetical protein [Candidatus Saccharimonadales bacterium]